MDTRETRVCRLSAVISGVTAHGARPQLGVNAVDAAVLAVNALMMLRLPAGFSGGARLLSADAGDSSVNMIPGRVTMSVELSCRGESESGTGTGTGAAREAMEELAAEARRAILCSAESIGARAEIHMEPENGGGGEFHDQ